MGGAMEVVPDALVTPTELVGPGELAGCVYTAGGSIVRLSERFGGYRGDHFRSVNKPTLPRSPKVRQLPGRGVYLGSYMGGHYGHFVTEGLSSFWIFDEQPVESFDHFIFQAFVFSDRITPYVRFCLEAFGIDEGKVCIVRHEPVGVEELLVPERLFRLNHRADPRLRSVYQRIVASVDPPPESGKRVYLSRRKMSLRRSVRAIANEWEVEAEFRRRGFEVIYPEETEFSRQLEVYSSASVLAGMSGSGLHNSLFLSEGAMLVEIGDPRYRGERAPTQECCDRVARVDSQFVAFPGRRIPFVDVWWVGVRLLRVELNQVGLLDRESGASWSERVLGAVRGWTECGWIVLRGGLRRCLMGCRQLRRGSRTVESRTGEG